MEPEREKEIIKKIRAVQRDVETQPESNIVLELAIEKRDLATVLAAYRPYQRSDFDMLKKHKDAIQEMVLPLKSKELLHVMFMRHFERFDIDKFMADPMWGAKRYGLRSRQGILWELSEPRPDQVGEDVRFGRGRAKIYRDAIKVKSVSELIITLGHLEEVTGGKAAVRNMLRVNDFEAYRIAKNNGDSEAIHELKTLARSVGGKSFVRRMQIGRTDFSPQSFDVKSKQREKREQFFSRLADDGLENSITSRSIEHTLDDILNRRGKDSDGNTGPSGGRGA